MKILVTFAVEAEFAPWRKRHDFRPREIRQSGYTYLDVAHSAEIGKHHVDVYLTGIGWHGSEYALNALLQEKPDIFISSGLAGGLSSALQSCSIVAARRVGIVNGKDSIGSRRGLLEIARECGASIVDLFLTSKHILSQAQFKKSMAEFGDVVEMESFHLLTLASGSQVPSIAVRAISDAVDEDLPLDFTRVVDPNGRVVLRQLMAQLFRYPYKIPALLRFGKRSKRAAEILADFLDRYLDALKKRSGELSSLQVEGVAI